MTVWSASVCARSRLLLALLAAGLWVPAADCDTLVFSIDQGFGNGIVQQLATDVLQTVLLNLQQLRKVLPPDTTVAALYNPMLANRSALETALDLTVGSAIPFVLDIYSSDCATLGPCSIQNRPYDASYGLSISMSDMQAIKQRYGRWFAGVRIFEVFAFDFTIRAVKNGANWSQPCWHIPQDNFFQADLAEQIVAFAYNNSMFVQWSDWHWYAFAPWDAPTRLNEAAMASIIERYPDTVTVTYANNEPNGDSIQRLPNWQEAFQQYPLYGVSDQAWICADTLNCSALMTAWAANELNVQRPPHFVQLEPVWSLFNVSLGSFAIGPLFGDGSPTETYRNVTSVLTGPDHLNIAYVA
eukprot:TRINITY_DN14324_c0_g1_i1.p1 TRINITY_DN14324_c0_g1~~TRINITY_DN14324_c0_g1_i1.p1  ORF type:complete len:356 (-),score=96.99 TRINITY_DN14324_c0_g1_i1:55-1122(-)